MTDPAVEAAKRAEEASDWWKSPEANPWDAGYATDAAREALKPIQDWYLNPDSQWGDLLPLLFPNGDPNDGH